METNYFKPEADKIRMRNDFGKALISFLIVLIAAGCFAWLMVYAAEHPDLLTSNQK
jgi:hypothetical protein